MREQWRTGSGFILASVGAAVGIGNIWRFAYVAGENGGGAFLLLYLLLVAGVGLPLVIAELAIGKGGVTDAATAFSRLAPRSPWRHAGWLGVAGAVLILGYYAVIAGWALRYFAASLTGTLWAGAAEGFGGYFSRFIADGGEPLVWQLAMMLVTMLVVGAGVRQGVERMSLLLMPLLAAIVVALAAYSLSLPGGGAGLAFLFAPDWAAVTDPRVILAALGQAFFSIGLGMAVFITYGSYMRLDSGVARAAGLIVAGDTLFALVAGLAIFPAVFALGGDPAAGPELAFITLPQVFLTMPGGRLVGTVFFFLLSAAALTSMVALLEVPVAVAMSRLGIGRWSAVAAVGLAITLMGAPSAMSYGLLDGLTLLGLPILDAVDRVVSDLVLPLAGLAVAVFFGWVLPRHRAGELAELAGGRATALFFWLLRAAPVLILALLAFRLLGVRP